MPTTKKVVHTPTQEDCDRLMEAYEKKKWRCCTGQKATEFNYWSEYKSKTCISFEDEFSLIYRDWCVFRGYTIISTNEAIKRLTQTNMPTFKHGDRVTCEINGIKITDAKISIDEDGTPFICQNEFIGWNAENKLGYKYSYKLDKDFNCSICGVGCVMNIRPLEKTWDNIEVGDVLKNTSGRKRWVLGVCGRAIFVSILNDPNRSDVGYYIKEELIKIGYTIDQPEQKDEVEELTMEQVCQELGRTIKIKK